jgi:hypothetical protein
MSGSWGDTSRLYGAPPPSRRPGPTAKTTNKWVIAVAAYLLGTVVVLALGFLIGLAGIVFVTGATLGGADLTDRDLIATTVLVAVVPLLVSVAVQAVLIHRCGGANHLLAPIAAVAAGWLLSLLLTPIPLPSAVLFVLGAAVQIGVLAVLVGGGVRTPGSR